MATEEQGPSWFSIKDAAKYLNVGEPTIYRWMREGRITYRKIGDSTRFLQEDLDAMVKVFPSEKEVGKVREFCPLCHNDDLAPGREQSTGRLYFHPDNVRFWTLRESLVPTHSKMCSRCGYIATFGDADKLASLRKDDGSEPEEEPDASEDETVTDDAAGAEEELPEIAKE